MNSGQIAMVTAPEIIKQRLKDAKIAEAAVVDEVFDGISAEALGRGLDDFVTALENEALLTEAQKFCPELTEPTDFDVDRAKELWAARDQWSDVLKPQAELLFNPFCQRHDTVNQLVNSLTQLDIKVHALGVDAPVPSEVRLVFLDYCLEPEKDIQIAEIKQQQIEDKGKADDTPGSGALAEKIATRLADLGASRPFLVLISDRKELTNVQAGFRRRTHYLAGTFACLAKSEAANPESLYFFIGCWGIGHPAHAPITEFFNALVESLGSTAKEFQEALLELDAQDYSFIQRLSLAADGEPLGEYVLDLVAGALNHRLRNRDTVLAARLALDKQHFPTHLPSTTQPSRQVRRLYQQALTDRGPEPLAGHPLQDLQVPQPQKTMPRVALGDIFANDDHKTVYMVVNAACDLQFSPINPKRLADPSLPVYLVPGELELLSHSARGGANARTEIFELENQAYRILWDHRHVLAVPLHGFETWCLNGQYRRVARLGLVHALSVQQTWTAHLSRVGVPVTPPLTTPADFRIYLRDAEGKLRASEERVKEQVILGRYRKRDTSADCFILTRESVSLLRAALSTSVQSFMEFAANVPAGPHQAGKAGALRKLAEQGETAKSNWGYWYELLEREHELPREDGSTWVPDDQVKKPIAFCWQAYPEGKRSNEFGGGETLVVVDILRPESPDAPIAAATTTQPQGGESLPESSPASGTPLTSTSAQGDPLKNADPPSEIDRNP